MIYLGDLVMDITSNCNIDTTYCTKYHSSTAEKKTLKTPPPKNPYLTKLGYACGNPVSLAVLPQYISNTFVISIAHRFNHNNIIICIPGACYKTNTQISTQYKNMSEKNDFWNKIFLIENLDFWVFFFSQYILTC